MKKVAIIIPAYNEEKTIDTVISGLQKTLKNQPFDFEVIVVDDGSKDKTYPIAVKSGIRVIKHIMNSGQGAATTTGLSYAAENNFNIAATLDADGQHDPNDILNGINIMLKNTRFDLLIGSRMLEIKDMPRSKVLGNRGLSFFTYLLFGVKTTDSQSGLRLFSKKAISELRWRATGYEFCSEMIWRAKQAKLNIDEFPIRTIYTDYSRQKGQNNWNAFNIIKSLMRSRIMEMFGE